MDQHLSDEAWMIRLQGSDHAALEVLYHRYADRLMGFLYKMVSGDRALAEDLLHDVFLRVASQAQRFDAGRSFRAWVFTIAANLARNQLRTIHREQEEVNPDLGILDSGDEDRLLHPIDQPQFARLLDQALDELSSAKRTAFLLRYQIHLPLEEIAEIQGCSTGTVKSRLFYTLRYLETRLHHFHPLNQSS